MIFAVGVWAAFRGMLNPSFFIMAFFLCLAAVKELKSAPYVLIRDFSGKREAIAKRKTLHINRFAALQTQPVGDVMRAFEAGKYNMVTVIGKDMDVVGELSEQQILGGMMQKGTQVTLGSVWRQHSTPPP